MNEYYLRIEGVNFDSFVLDTNRIKIIRGGSLMLLNAPEWIKDQLSVKLEQVSAGASFGLFRFQADDDQHAGKVAKEAADAFNDDMRYRHATITVAVQPETEDFSRDHARLEAISHWQQMRFPSLAIPSAARKPVKGPCEFDKLRPATHIAKLVRDEDENGKNKADISAACQVRWFNDGEQRERKYTKNSEENHILPQSFYQKRTKHEILITRDLKMLTDPPDDQYVGNLKHKMAVIYLDGNHFGNLARENSKTWKNARKFDQTLRKQYQDKALETLIDEIKKESQGWKNDGRLRLDTLLWGGDEIIWVVPAWKGWWMLGRFIEITQGWNIGGRLTHGAGLVFCHHNAPIQPILALARQLGDIAKGAGNRKENRVAYQVLESFDHAGVDLGDIRKMRWPLEDIDEMVILGDTMLAASHAVYNIKKLDFPKRQLYKLAQLVQAGQHKDARDKAEALQQAANINVDDWKKVEQCFNPDLAAWLHLLELWDFVGLEEGS